MGPGVGGRRGPSPAGLQGGLPRGPRAPWPGACGERLPGLRGGIVPVGCAPGTGPGLAPEPLSRWPIVRFRVREALRARLLAPNKAAQPQLQNWVCSTSPPPHPLPINSPFGRKPKQGCFNFNPQKAMRRCKEQLELMGSKRYPGLLPRMRIC